MTVLGGILAMYDAGVVALAVAAALNLRRRGGAAWTGAFLPAALAQLALAAVRLEVPLSRALGWLWLAQTAANLLLIYGLWQAGSLALADRAAAAEPEVEAEPAVIELPRIRALASWPGRVKGSGV
jgi:hypothetical protein